MGRAVGEGCGLDVLVVVGGLTGIQPTLVGNSHGSERPDQPHRPGVPRVPTGSFLGISPTLPQASSWVTQTLRAAQEERTSTTPAHASPTSLLGTGVGSSSWGPLTASPLSHVPAEAGQGRPGRPASHAAKPRPVRGVRGISWGGPQVGVAGHPLSDHSPLDRASYQCPRRQPWGPQGTHTLPHSLTP